MGIYLLKVPVGTQRFNGFRLHRLSFKEAECVEMWALLLWFDFYWETAGNFCDKPRDLQPLGKSGSTWGADLAFWFSDIPNQHSESALKLTAYLKTAHILMETIAPPKSTLAPPPQRRNEIRGALGLFHLCLWTQGTRCQIQTKLMFAN